MAKVQNQDDARVETDVVSVYLLNAVVMVTGIMLCIMITDCLLGVDMSDFMFADHRKSVDGNHSFSTSSQALPFISEISFAFSEVLKIISRSVDAVVSSCSPFMSENVTTELGRLLDVFMGAFVSFTHALSAFWNIYLPLIAQTLMNTYISVAEYIEPLADNFLSYLQKSFHKLTGLCGHHSSDLSQGKTKIDFSHLDLEDMFGIAVLGLFTLIAFVVSWSLLKRMFTLLKLLFRILAYVSIILKVFLMVKKALKYLLNIILWILLFAGVIILVRRISKV